MKEKEMGRTCRTCGGQERCIQGLDGGKLSERFRTRRYDKIKLKSTPVQALRLCTGHMAHRGSRGIALPFHDHGTRRG